MEHDPPKPDPWHTSPRDAPPPASVYPPILPPPIPPAPKPKYKPLTAVGQTRVVIAWSAIVFFTLMAIIVQRAAMDLPTFDEQLLAQPSLQITVQSKIAMGMESFVQSDRAATEELLAQIEAVSQTPTDFVRRAIMTAELIDADQALLFIQKLRADQNRLELTDNDLRDLDALESVYRGATLPQAEADRLLNRHGWFGELATSFNQNKNSTSHQAPRGAGTRAIIAVGLFGLYIICMGFAGLVCFVLVLVYLGQGKFRARFIAFPGPRDTPILGEGIAIFLGIFAVSGLTTVYLVYNYQTNASLIGLILLTLCPLIPLIGLGWKKYCHYIGLNRGEGFFKEIACGLYLYIAGLPLVVVGFTISFVLMLLFPVELENPVVDPFSGLGPGGLVLIVLLLVVWAPVVEEVVFRGIFYSFSRRWLAWPIASAVVGVIFAAIHPQWVWFIPGLASVGFVFGLIREWRGSIIGAMAAHALHNGSIAVLVVTMLLA